MAKKTIFLLFILWVSAESSWAQETSGSPYFLELQNGQRHYARKLQYRTPVFKQNHFLLDDTLRFAPEPVRYFQNHEGFFARVNAGRRFSDFAQREQAGKVSTYFVLRTEYNNFSPGIGMGAGMGGVGIGMGGGYGGYATQRKVYYFSKDNGPLQPLTYRNLRVALSDNAGAVESLQQYKRGQNIQTGLYVAGAGLILAGLNQQFNGPANTGGFSPLLLVGTGVLLIPQIIRLVRKDRLAEAVELYNYVPVN